MIHLYYGDGKGKTTAAVGLSVRALGNGWRVVFVQFLKNTPCGEVTALERLGATVLRGKAGEHFFSKMTDAERRATREISDRNLERALSLCARAGQTAPLLLVLDEVCAACRYDLVDGAAVDSLVRSLRQSPHTDAAQAPVELVLTGREPPEHFFAAADYITEFRKERHPFDLGIRARKGVEF